jgi:hypothetical protein
MLSWLLKKKEKKMKIIDKKLASTDHCAIITTSKGNTENKERIMKKVKIIAKIAAQGQNVVKGKGAAKFVVCAQVQRVQEGNFQRDHVNIFPEDWANAKLAEAIQNGALQVGEQVAFAADVVQYRRANGSIAQGFKNVQAFRKS